MKTPAVKFVGAGPGAEDLITLRGAQALEDADVVVYAGSLVNPAHLRRCRPSCICHDSAPLSLEEQVQIMQDGILAGQNVVRLHTGDPAMYGAIAEQMEALSARGIASSIIPGVSSVFGAAAALGCELTYPNLSQSVVLTRTAGRTPMPQGEQPAAFARTGATLVFFLSAGNLDTLVRELTDDGGLPQDTPAAVVYRATWPDERIVRGTLADIAAKTTAAGIGRQALVLVGQALNASGKTSQLYAETFSHGYRNHLDDERFDGSVALYAFTAKGRLQAETIAAGLAPRPVTLYAIGNHAAQTEHGVQPQASEQNSTGQPSTEQASTGLSSTGQAGTKAVSRGTEIVTLNAHTLDEHLARVWRRHDAHVFLGAAGIAIRKTARLLHDKTTDPALLSCSETGAHVVSLLAGHLGGANRLARRIARITGGEAVITTATDSNTLPAFDDIAAREHARIVNPDAIRELNSALLHERPIALCGARHMYERYYQDVPHVRAIDRPEERHAGEALVLWQTTLPSQTDADLLGQTGAVLPPQTGAVLPASGTSVSSHAEPSAPPTEQPLAADHAVLHIQQRCLVLGIGCRRGISSAALEQAASALLAEHGLRPDHLLALSSCDLKADEPALIDLARTWGIPLECHARADLESIATPTPSEQVREKIGIPSVSEASAILSVTLRLKASATLADSLPSSLQQAAPQHASQDTPQSTVAAPRADDHKTLAAPQPAHSPDTCLCVPKVIGDGMTFALAQLPHGARTPQHTQGELIVVGIGSGSAGQITPEVSAALEQCDIVAGYTPYLDMIRERLAGKPLIQNGMLGEVERCRAALKAADQGYRVCMVCSGDPGILAMAGLLYELRAREFGHRSPVLPITVLPGVTAANLAAATLGAPLQNGFSLISLSDLLVPAEEVRQNLHAAARGALPVVLYNPAGRKRRHLLEEALDLFLAERGGDTLCALVRHAGRHNEDKWIGTLAELPRERVDMSTLVLIGSQRTQWLDGALYEARGYADKYLEPQDSHAPNAPSSEDHLKASL